MNLNTKYKSVNIGLLAVMAVGLLSWMVALVIDAKWGLLLTNFSYFVGISEAAIFIVVMLRMTNAKWARPIFRLGGLITYSFIPMAAAMFVVVLLGQGALFYWIGGEGSANPWLNPLFFTVRELLFFVLFYYFAYRIFKISVDNDDIEEHSVDRSLLFRSVPLLIIFVVHQSIMGWDLAMTLFPHFLSTIFTIRYWVTNVYGGFAAMILIFAGLKKYFGVKSLGSDQFFHFGNLLLAFSVFWIYFTWSDFFPFWYANLPEEMPALYRVMLGEQYRSIYLIRLILAGVPFFILTFTKVRKNPNVLSALAVPILIGIWLERYLMVIPPMIFEGKMDYSPLIGVTNVLFSIGILGGFIASIIFAASRYENIITREPEPDHGHH